MGGSSSKTAFADIISQLLHNDIDAADHDFWDELWKTSLTVGDVFSLISPDDVRKLINERPKNLQTLFSQAVAQLYQVVETPYPVYFEQALNCARILSRLLPFMLESESKIVRSLCWARQYPSKAEGARAGEGNENDGETNGQSIEEEAPAQEAEIEPLAVILINSIFHLLFLPDFTIEDPNTDFNEDDLQTQQFKTALMWAPGVGSSEKSVFSSTPYDKNRIDILRLMVAAFSDSLYQNPDTYDSCSSMWLEVGSSVDTPYAEIVFYSLMNVVLGYDPIGWGLPYGNFVSQDTAKPLMESSIHALLILLDYGNPILPPDVPPPQGPTTTPNSTTTAALPYVSALDTDAQGFNIFRKLLGSVEAIDQLNFIYRGFVRLLNNVHQSQNTFLPYSITKIETEQELLVLLWKCLEEMPAFMPYILRYCDVTELLVPICFLLLEGRRDPAKLGLMYLCTFILLKLSGERSFGVALNKPYQLKLPVDLPLFTGIHADLLTIVLHKMIVSGLDKLSALYNCFLTIICNISPYCKSLSAVASVKLVNLFQLFTSPKFLYAAESNHAHVTILLETFNNIVQYQYEGNVNMVYALVRRKEVFEGLANLTLPSALQTAIELANKRAKRSEEDKLRVAEERGKEEPALEARPTDLISTRHVERRAGQEGDVERSKQSTTGSTEVNGKSELAQSEGEVATPVTGAALSSTSAASGDENSGTDASVVSGTTTTTTTTTAALTTELRFRPSQEWLDAVKSELPLNTIMRLLKHLVPQVEELASHGSIEESQVLEFIKRTTMVGLLPVPHPIVIRKYQPNRFTSLWFTAYLWGVIFMHNQEIPLFDGRTVKLFMVQTAV